MGTTILAEAFVSADEQQQPCAWTLLMPVLLLLGFGQAADVPHQAFLSAGLPPTTPSRQEVMAQLVLKRHKLENAITHASS